MFPELKIYLQRTWDRSRHQGVPPWPVLLVAVIPGLILLLLVANLSRAGTGQMSGVLSSLLGGLIGAGGAVWLAYFLIDRQRNAETGRIRATVNAEASVVKYIKGTNPLDRTDLRRALSNDFAACVKMISDFDAYLRRNWNHSLNQGGVPWSILLVAAVPVLLFLIFAVNLFHVDAGQVSSALGSLIGGIVGAGSAVWALHFTISRDRNEETSKVGAAVSAEVAAFARYIIGAVQLCEDIVKGTVKIQSRDAADIAKNFWGGPSVYPAVANKIALLPHPRATIEFYVRMAEAKGMLEERAKNHPVAGPGGEITPDYVTPDVAANVADRLIIALRVARRILVNEGAGETEPHVTDWVQASVVEQIDACLQAAKESFPNTALFYEAPPAEHAQMH